MPQTSSQKNSEFSAYLGITAPFLGLHLRKRRREAKHFTNSSNRIKMYAKPFYIEMNDDLFEKQRSD